MHNGVVVLLHDQPSVPHRLRASHQAVLAQVDLPSLEQTDCGFPPLQPPPSRRNCRARSACRQVVEGAAPGQACRRPLSSSLGQD